MKFGMPIEGGSLPPLLWVSGDARNNVVVLAGDVLYVATMGKADLPKLDVGLDEGRKAYELLPAKVLQIPLESLTRIQFKQLRRKSAFEVSTNRDATLHYRDQDKDCSVTIALENERVRDQVVQTLLGRLGSWAISEAHVPAWLILGRYVYVMTVLSLVTFFFCWLEVSDYWNRHGATGAAGRVLNRYLDACGVWGIFVPGAFAIGLALFMAVRQLRTPPVIVTYQPETGTAER
jgi:hypothetical protein